MNSETWPRVRRILEAAMDCPPHRRGRLLDRACRGDAELRRQVCDLLESEPPDADWLDSPVPGAAASLLELSQLVVRTGRIGRYRVGELIAVGGMGVVLRGEDDSDGKPRPVAIKILRRGLCTPRTLRAFRREQRLLDRLDHPNIARLLDSGISPDGLPYIAMEYIEGRPIDEHVRDAGVPIREQLELFRSACLAAHYAHQHLIVHRDLKPGNILVRRDGTVKLLDFGIAKLLDGDARREAPRTETLAEAMTLQYSSPEQIRGEPLTTATDIYSLGVTLYELLTGRPPWDVSGCSRYEAEKLMCETSPPTPSAAFAAGPSGGRAPWGSALDRIVVKSLDSDPRRRYASAEQFAEDIRRYLEGSTVLAYQPGRIERVAGAIRRNKLVFGVAATSFLLVSALAIVSTIMARAATQARDREVKARQVSERIGGFMSELLSATSPGKLGPSAPSLHILEEASSLVGKELRDQPEIAAGIYQQIGANYYHLRRTHEAIRSYRMALAEYRRCDLADPARLADCLSALGAALSYHDDEEGLDMQREALRLRQAMYGEHDARVANSLHGLAFALTRCARPPKYQEAEELYRRALALRRQLGLGESAASAHNLHALAAVMRHQGRLEESAEHYDKALTLSRRVLPATDTQLIDCLDDYAICLRDLGRYDQAEKLLNESLALTRQALGEVPATETLCLLARVARARGDRAEAWRLLNRALACLGGALSAERLGPAAGTWTDLMEQLSREPRTPQAEVYRRFVALAPVSNSAADLPPAAYSQVLDNLAGLTAEEGDGALAEWLSLEAIRTLEAHNPEDRLVRASFDRTRAEALIGLGRNTEARAILLAVADWLRLSRGPEHRETRGVEARLASIAAAPPSTPR